MLANTALKVSHLIRLPLFIRSLFGLAKPTPLRCEPYPTVETVDGWDDASLCSVVGFKAASRAKYEGFKSLNKAERILSSIVLFQGDVNNGGFGMWLDGLRPDGLSSIVPALETVGASEMVSLVRSTLAEFGDLERFTSQDEWQLYLETLPDTFHNGLELLSSRYVEAENEMLEGAYQYARHHWQQVRTESSWGSGVELDNQSG